MASASSPVVRSLIRDGKSVANILFRCTTNFTATETVQNTGPAIRSLLRFNQTPVCEYPVFSKNVPVMQFGVRFIEQEAVSERIGKVEAAHGKREDADYADSEERETDFDEEEFDDLDIDDDEVFEDLDDYDDEDEDDKYTRKKK